MIEGLTQTVLSVYDSVGVTLSSDEGFSLMTDCRSNRIYFTQTKVVMFKPLSTIRLNIILE